MNKFREEIEVAKSLQKLQSPFFIHGTILMTFSFDFPATFVFQFQKYIISIIFSLSYATCFAYISMLYRI